MGVPGNADLLLLRSAAAAGGYTISRSLRFNSSDSAYLSRTPASAGNRKTWTWAGWVKRSGLGARYGLFNAFAASPLDSTALEFDANNKLWFYNYTTGFNFQLITTSVYRDPSAWLHICLAVDVTQGTASNRVKLYVNGTQVTAFDTASYPADQNWNVNSTNTHYIGGGYDNQYYASFYLADIHFIDGQALTPSSFTETDLNGVLQPKAYSGSYGTNGFHLDFADNSNNTATTLGKDTSGAGNNWTPNNLSVTAGAGNDSLVDSPTNGTASTGGDAGGVTVGNYCTWNPLDNGGYTLSNGNLEVIGGAAWYVVRGTIGMSSGKWYWETVLTSGIYMSPGIATRAANLSTSLGVDAFGWNYRINVPDKYTNGSGTTYGATLTTGDVLGTAFDADNGTLTYYKNGVSQGTAFTGLTSGPYFPATGVYLSTSITNFGQRPFAYTAPSGGFKALCTANLPTPTIANGATAMDVKLYTGNGSTQTISGLNFSPDLVWVKCRVGTRNHVISDIIRGTNNVLASNTTSAQVSPAVNGQISAFNSDGFAVAAGTSDALETNNLNDTYAAWCWDAGTSTVTNTQGSITSQVRANASAGFSIVTYTGSGSTSTIGHGLGVAPQLIITKNRSSSSFSWGVYHASAGNSVYGKLNLADAFSSLPIWQNTSPTSTVFYVGNYNAANQASDNYVAFCWAPVAGYSSMSSFVGNGSSDGVFVYTGHRTKWLIIKRTDAAGWWSIWDTSRNSYNAAGANLWANGSDQEYTSAEYNIDFLSNGFKLRNAHVDRNASGGTYVFASFAEHPFTYARAR